MCVCVWGGGSPVSRYAFRQEYSDCTHLYSHVVARVDRPRLHCLSVGGQFSLGEDDPCVGLVPPCQVFG